MTIFRKLLISMVALTSIVLIATLSLARWSFEQGFTEFINGLEKERLGRIAEQIVVEYDNADNNWQNIQNYQMLLGGRAAQSPPRGPRRGPPPGGRFEQADPNPPPRPNFGSALPLTHLVNTEGKLLLSSASEQADRGFQEAQANDGIKIEMPVLYQGETIAYLRSFTPKPLNGSLASQFESQQLKASYLIGAVSLTVAIGLAFFIAKLFVRPIKQLSKGVSQLTEGKYQLDFENTGTDELGQLMRDTESLAKTLDKARSQKSRWFADISHELRTPLTILMGEIEAIRAGIRKFDSKQLDSIEQEVNLLHRLVDDLYQLSLSDMGALKYEFKNTNLSSMVTASSESFRPHFEEKNIQLLSNITKGIHHLIDPQRFEQLLNNLLNNSLKYTDIGGMVQVALWQTENEILLRFEDSAPGVPLDECERLFDTLYQRNTSRNRNNSGAGLGLAICKNIAESHHAKITASPSELGGIKVVLSLSKSK